MGKYDHVFQPLTIRGRTLKNRIEFSPMVPNLASGDGDTTDALVEYIAAQARTGAAYVTIGDCQIEYATGASFLGELNVEKPESLTGLYRLAEAAHENGALLSIELSHAGAGANPDMITETALSPSGVTIPAPMCARKVRAMDRKDMDHIIAKWCDCAKRCVTAGFDMILVHSAHQNLLGQFLSRATNTRTDEYGGSLENRMRFPLEVLQAVREAIGEKIILVTRLSGQEEVVNGMTIDEVAEYSRHAQKFVDIINISRGSIFYPEAGILHMPSYLSEKCINVDLAAKVKAVVDVPVSVPGNILTIDDAEQVLAEGKADIVGMARSLMAEPDLIHHAMIGHTERSRPCIRCMDCSKFIGSGLPMRCAINPVHGREWEFKYAPAVALKKEKVVVVGGGIAGLEAAKNCARRGHEVVLMEKSDRLGGLLQDASVLPFKTLLRNYLDWSISTAEKCSADIRMNTVATVENIRAEHPDSVIVATGSTYLRPPIPGINLPHVLTTKEVDSGKATVGQKVIVCGAGITGIETATYLARMERDVTILDMIPSQAFGSTLQPFLYMTFFLQIFPKYGVKLLGDHRIAAFTEKGLVADTPDGRREIEADSIVLALGLKPNNPLETELREIYPLTVQFIGDCTGNGNIFKAVHDAYMASVKI